MPLAPYARWRGIATLRQWIFFALVTGPALVAGVFMAQTLPQKGANLLELAIILVFTVLFGGIALGFWLSFFGLATLMRPKPDPWAISAYLKNDDGSPADIPLDGRRTAILMPICQEDITRVAAGLRASYESLQRTGQLEHFEFFILSDTKNPDLWVDEELAWADLVESLGAQGRLHYRRRRVGLKRKSGNIADFCRRWGRDFEFMIVFDADSVMTGPVMVDLVKLMIRRPEAGLIQTVPQGVMKTTPLARLQQFCGQAYGPIFAAGLSWLLLGGALFWGHNAIIRIQPFMKHCGLPRLAGLAPLGGDIMSHDFVESALLKRAGWDVWVAYDLDGSYEELPPTLLDELKRDQRWCQGNLQHLKILWANGLSLTQRLMFVNGAFSYLSSFFWFIALMLGSLEAALMALSVHDYFPTMGLFPQWPTWTGQWAVILLSVTALFLFAPKIMALIHLVGARRTPAFGGGARLFLGVLSETVFSTLAAPIRMLFHSKVIFLTLLGSSVGWKSQNRDDRAVPFKDALRFHGGGMLLAVAWALIIIKCNPSFAWWLSPIWIALLLSPVLTTVSSLPSLGRFLMRWGLWRIPQESAVPPELARVAELDAAPDPASPFGELGGFARAVLDPAANRLHISLLGAHRRVETSIRLRRQMLAARLLDHGPSALAGPNEMKNKTEILSDPLLLASLHRELWSAPKTKLDKWLTISQLNLSNKKSAFGCIRPTPCV